MTGLRVENCSFAYARGSQNVIENLSHAFTAGAMTAITGRSGRGKSTVLYLAALLLTPASGDVWLDDERVSRALDKRKSELRALRYGFVFQDALLDSGRSVLDNVAEPALYSRGLTREDVTTRALALMDELGVDVDPRRKPGQISGGQAQRIALCRALLLNPSIIVADEPTASLDLETKQVILAALRERAERGATVIVATHDPAVISLCNSVLAL